MQHVEPSIVRFRYPDGEVCGAGFLVSNDLVCTCAHVVAAALDQGAEAKPPEHTQVRLEFPFLQGGVATATIEDWTPASEGDIAILKLTSPPPADARNARLLRSTNLVDRAFRVLGFPARNDEGAWAYGRLGRRRANGTVQLEGERVTGYAVQPGFSGAPVWDSTSRGVAGMIVASETNQQTKVAVMVPTDFIAARCRTIVVPATSPVQSLGEGLAGLPNAPLDGFEHFVREYLGTRQAPAPFGGRDAALIELDRWFVDLSRPFGLLVAEAGRGKSALLMRWVAGVAERERVDVVLVPISIRFGTATKVVALSMLGARLRHLNNEGGDPPADPGAWVGEISTVLKLNRPDGCPLLLVLDGADEATDWSIGQDLHFPANVGRGVKILVSARAVAGRGAPEWARVLGWDDADTSTFALPLLSPAGVSQAIKSMGKRLAALADQPEVTAEISRLSEGDPLLVRLWAETLRDALTDGLSKLTVSDLTRMEPGLSSFFDQWWEDQQVQWRQQGRDLEHHHELLMQFFYLCAMALGPLSRQEVAELGKQKWTSTQISDITRDVGRFVIGNGKRQGWVFSHPKLGQYFSEEAMVDADREEWEERFLDLGRGTLKALCAGQSVRRDRTYGLLHYGAHLQRVHTAAEDFDEHYRDSTCDCAERLHELITRAWQRAREDIEGSNNGFLSDLDSAWRHAEAEGRRLLRSDVDGAPFGRPVTRQVRYALIKSSIQSLTGHLPPEMISALVRQRIWTAAQALSHIRGLPETDRAAALVALAPSAPNLRHEIVAMTRAIADPSVRFGAMLNLAVDQVELDDAITMAELQTDLATALKVPRTSLHWFFQTAPVHVFDLALTLARGIVDPLSRVQLLESIAQRLEEPARSEVLVEALASVGELPAETVDPLSRVQMLERIAQRLEEPARSEVLVKALAIVGELPAEQQTSVPLSLLTVAPPERRRALSQAVLDARTSVRDPSERAQFLQELAQSLPEGERGRVHAELFNTAMQIEDSIGRASVVRTAAAGLPQSLVPTALEILRSIGQDPETESHALSTRAGALAELAAHLSEPYRAQITAEAFTTARSIEDEYWRAIALSHVAEHLSDALVDEAVQATAALASNSARLNILSRLTPYRDRVGASALAAEVLPELPSHEAIEALVVLIPHLTAETLIEALKAAGAVDEEFAYLNNVFQQGLSKILALVMDLPPDEQLELLAAAVELPSKISRNRAGALAKLSPHLPESMLRTLLGATWKIADPLPQALALTGLLPHLPADKRLMVISDVLIRTGPALGFYKHIDVLNGLIPWLSPQQVENVVTTLGHSHHVLPALTLHLSELGDIDRALKLARSFDAETRVTALAALIDKVPSEQMPTVWEEVLSATQAINPRRRANLLLEFGLSQSPPRRERLISAALLATQDIEEPLDQIAMQAKMIAYLGPQERKHLLDRLTVFVAKDIDQVAALANVAPHLDPEERGALVDRLTVAANSLPTERDKAAAFAQIGFNLSGPDRHCFLSEALQHANAVRYSSDRSNAFRSMASLLPELLLPTAVNYATHITDEQSRANALEGLAPYLPEPLVREAIAATELFYSKFWQGQALRGLVVRLAQLGHGEEALNRAVLLERGFYFADALGEMAPHLPAELLASALDHARLLDSYLRSKALAGLLPRQGDIGEVTAALKEAATIDETQDRATVLAYLTQRLSAAEDPTVYESWSHLLQELAKRPRSELLSDLGAFAPLLAQLGGTTAVIDVAEAIAETVRWFP
jgi:hypothetical protein